jgi:hypothetical protein
MKYKVISSKSFLTVSEHSPHLKWICSQEASDTCGRLGKYFDFQGEQSQQGGAIIFSPGEFKAQVLLLNSCAFYNSKGQAFTP